MSLLRLYLLLIGGFSLVIGLVYMIRPVEMAALMEIELESPTAVLDVQGFYGGQLFGLGAAILVGLWSPRFVVPALVLAIVPLAGTALGRLYGVATSGVCPSTIAGLILIEVVVAGAGAFLLRRELAQPPGT